MKQDILLEPSSVKQIRVDKCTVRVIIDSDAFDAIADEWTALAEASDTTIFQTYEWNRTWWKYFGKKGTLNILLFYQQDELAGIAPLFFDEVHLLRKKIYSCLRFIGSNVIQSKKDVLIGLSSYTDYLDFIVRTGCEEWLRKQFTNFILSVNLKSCRIQFDAVKENSFTHQLLPNLGLHGFRSSIFLSNVCYIVNLPEDWEHYLMSLSKDTRSHTRRALKKIYHQDQKLFEIQQITGPDEIENHFDEMVEIHQNRWRRNGYLGTFAENSNYQFQKKIAQTFSTKGWIQINKLLSVNEQNRCIAVDVNYRYKNRIYGAHCAVDDQSAYYKKGPGTILLSFGLQDAVFNKIPFFDFLRGSENYKKAYSNHSKKLYRILVHHPENNSLYRAEFIQRMMLLKRKLVRECTHLRYLVANVSFLKGLQKYQSLLFQRISKRVKQ